MEATGCDAETADTLLEQSHGAVKPAILMHLTGIDYETALKKLNANQGHLKQALK
jgi:N-acetylmuramic acid 6-phosphate etherase